MLFKDTIGQSRENKSRMTVQYKNIGFIRDDYISIEMTINNICDGNVI